jgi:2-oxo-4-hydroxy-4-carboxy-5-ureidoimidazoline decarboxylase
VELPAFNALPADRAEEALLAVCAAPSWAAQVAAARPYASKEKLQSEASAAYDRLTWDDVAEALAAHPRIGQRLGQSAAGETREAAWSRREQSGVQGAAEDVQAELAEANRAYEERFGYLFLIFASGKSAPEILAAARERLGHDDATEQAVVREELRKIVALRLERLTDE